MRPWNPNTKSTGRPGDWTPPLRQTVPVGAHCASAHWPTEAGRCVCLFQMVFALLWIGLAVSERHQSDDVQSMTDVVPPSQSPTTVTCRDRYGELPVPRFALRSCAMCYVYLGNATSTRRLLPVLRLPGQCDQYPPPLTCATSTWAMQPAPAASYLYPATTKHWSGSTLTPPSCGWDTSLFHACSVWSELTSHNPLPLKRNQAWTVDIDLLEKVEKATRLMVTEKGLTYEERPKSWVSQHWRREDCVET